MITSQRLIMIGIMLNILLGWGITVYINPYQTDTSSLTREYGNINAKMLDFVNEDQLQAEDDNPLIQEEKSTGNLLYWSGIIYDVMINAINPFSMPIASLDTTIEKFCSIIILLFRILFATLMAIEVVLVIKNKKTT